MYVLGTAGHVDHGKSTLVHALTGIDPDRLREEKERGMTIDLGFAWLTLPSGQVASIVDVPGHERFIKNMLAGVGGIDAALLVVAADEGVMPQTREHLAILDLLRVSCGVVAVTKIDLVDEEWLALVVAEIEEVLAPTTLAGSPIVPVSAVTGVGLDRLVATLEAQLARAQSRADRGRPRLPIDRVFTVAGFGTVVTGTLIDGSLEVGEEVEVFPAGRRSRGCVAYRPTAPGSSVPSQGAGWRSIWPTWRRASCSVVTWLARPGTLVATTAIDVRLRALASLERPLRHNSEVMVHVHTSETPARLRLLEGEVLPPGESGWAQLRTSSPLVVVKGDLFVLRSANETIGGGEVVEVGARRHRRQDPRVLGRLGVLARGSQEALIAQALAPHEPQELSAFLRTAPLPAAEARAALAAAVASGSVRVLGGRPLEAGATLITATGWTRLQEQAQAALRRYHATAPLRWGMSREELRSRLGLPSRVWPDVLAELIAAGGGG
ncbi:MAG: selenocysteine-specific translation factor [Dehalococcoidia bacterium]|nr:MAG: selenocysteine-specific translation factor [Dehalococcoidia bacterium]